MSQILLTGKSYRNFIEAIHSPFSKLNYKNSLSLYMKWKRVGSCDILLSEDPKTIQESIIDYIIYLREERKIASTSISTNVEQWIGLSEIGGIVTVSVSDLDFTRRIGVTPTTAKQTNGTEIKVLEVGTAEFSWGTLPKIYTTPFTKENVIAAIEKAQPSIDNDTRGKISYSLSREGYPNPISVSSLEEFIEGDFDEIWARKITSNQY